MKLCQAFKTQRFQGVFPLDGFFWIVIDDQVYKAPLSIVNPTTGHWDLAGPSSGEVKQIAHTWLTLYITEIKRDSNFYRFRIPHTAQLDMVRLFISEL